MLKDLPRRDRRENGAPRLVSIIGQAGIGKSRLAWEFLKYIDGVTRPSTGTRAARRRTARESASGRSPRWFAAAPGSLELDDAATDAHQAGRDRSSEWVPDEAERRWIEPRLAPAARDRRSRCRRAAATASRCSRHGASSSSASPSDGAVVLVFEDLQWADDGQLDFIDHVLEWSRDRPIYIITLARPELLDRRPDWGAGRRNFTSLVLEPLTDEEMRELLRPRARASPSRWSSAIARARRGHPALRRRDRPDAARRRRSSRSRAASIGPPATSPSCRCPPRSTRSSPHGSTRWIPADRSLLQAAAVIGKTFSLEALAAVSGLTSEETLERDCARSSAREMLTLEADPRSPERASTGSSRRSSARWPMGRWREPTDGASTSRRRATSRRSTTRASPARWPSTTSRPIKAQPEGPEGDAVAAQARVALRGAAERARSLGIVRAGRPLPGAGAGGHHRSGRGSAAPRGGRRSRPLRRADR